LRFLQFSTKIPIHSVPSYVTFSCLDKVDDTQWSSELLFREYWTQLIQTFHMSSVLLRHLTFQVTALSDHTARN
jgi:hypothetical protein